MSLRRLVAVLMVAAAVCVLWLAVAHPVTRYPACQVGGTNTV